MKDNVRVMASISSDLNNKLQILCDQYGMSKSSLIAYYIAKMVSTENKVNDLVNQETVNNLFSAMAKDLTKF